MTPIDFNKHKPGMSLWGTMQDTERQVVSIRRMEVQAVGRDRQGMFVDVGDEHPFREADKFFWSIDDVVENVADLLFDLEARSL